MLCGCECVVVLVVDGDLVCWYVVCDEVVVYCCCFV